MIALAAGVAVGAVLGVLFAPEKGEKTREDLLNKGKKFADDITRKVSASKEKCKETEEALN